MDRDKQAQIELEAIVTSAFSKPVVAERDSPWLGEIVSSGRWHIVWLVWLKGADFGILPLIGEAHLVRMEEPSDGPLRINAIRTHDKETALEIWRTHGEPGLADTIAILFGERLH